MKQKAKIIKRTYGDGTVKYMVRLHTIHDNAEQSISFIGGNCGPVQYDSIEEAKIAALNGTFTDTIEE